MPASAFKWCCAVSREPCCRVRRAREGLNGFIFSAFGFSHGAHSLGPLGLWFAGCVGCCCCCRCCCAPSPLTAACLTQLRITRLHLRSDLILPFALFLPTFILTSLHPLLLGFSSLLLIFLLLLLLRSTCSLFTQVQAVANATSISQKSTLDPLCSCTCVRDQVLSSGLLARCDDRHPSRLVASSDLQHLVSRISSLS